MLQSSPGCALSAEQLRHKMWHGTDREKAFAKRLLLGDPAYYESDAMLDSVLDLALQQPWADPSDFDLGRQAARLLRSVPRLCQRMQGNEPLQQRIAGMTVRISPRYLHLLIPSVSLLTDLLPMLLGNEEECYRPLVDAFLQSLLHQPALRSREHRDLMVIRLVARLPRLPVERLMAALPAIAGLTFDYTGMQLAALGLGERLFGWMEAAIAQPVKDASAKLLQRLLQRPGQLLADQEGRFRTWVLLATTTEGLADSSNLANELSSRTRLFQSNILAVDPDLHLFARVGGIQRLMQLLAVVNGPGGVAGGVKRRVNLICTRVIQEG